MFWWRNEVLPGVSVAFTDTAAGNLALHVGDDAGSVRERRAALELAAGLGERRFQYMNQVHGNAVAHIRGHGETPTADAMVSAGQTLSAVQPLAVMVADCVPVVLVGATESGKPPVTAVVHAGRPGVALGVVPAAVGEMRRQGANEVRAWIGPSICGSCYEVPEAMRADVAAVEPTTWSTTGWGTPGLDLPAGVRTQLESAGAVVEYAGTCTLEDERLFSYRRNRNTGRFAGLVWAHG